MRRPKPDITAKIRGDRTLNDDCNTGLRSLVKANSKMQEQCPAHVARPTRHPSAPASSDKPI